MSKEDDKEWWFPLGVTTFHRELELLDDEHGIIYCRLLSKYLVYKKHFSRDFEEISRSVRCYTPKKKNILQQVLDKFFKLHADGWHHEICDEEFLITKQFSDNASEYGKAGAKKRWAKYREEQQKNNRVPYSNPNTPPNALPIDTPNGVQDRVAIANTKQDKEDRAILANAESVDKSAGDKGPSNALSPALGGGEIASAKSLVSNLAQRSKGK